MTLTDQKQEKYSSRNKVVACTMSSEQYDVN
jgi:hypothetical protein